MLHKHFDNKGVLKMPIYELKIIGESLQLQNSYLLLFVRLKATI